MSALFYVFPRIEKLSELSKLSDKSTQVYCLILKSLLIWREAPYMYMTSTSQTAMMWQMLPASTKKWNTECM